MSFEGKGEVLAAAFQEVVTSFLMAFKDPQFLYL